MKSKEKTDVLRNKRGALTTNVLIWAVFGIILIGGVFLLVAWQLEDVTVGVGNITLAVVGNPCDVSQAGMTSNGLVCSCVGNSCSWGTVPTVSPAMFGTCNPEATQSPDIYVSQRNPENTSGTVDH